MILIEVPQIPLHQNISTGMVEKTWNYFLVWKASCYERIVLLSFLVNVTLKVDLNVILNEELHEEFYYIKTLTWYMKTWIFFSCLEYSCCE